MTSQATPPIYSLRLRIRSISPMIWRRGPARSDGTLAQLHDVLRIAFGWSGTHPHRPRIHGRDHGAYRSGGPGLSRQAGRVRLADFQSRTNERFLYEYDFGDAWQHRVRTGRGPPGGATRSYPLGVGGRRRSPPEGRGGPRAFLRRRDAAPLDVAEHPERPLESVDAGDREAVRDRPEGIEPLREWLGLGRFDRRRVNRRRQDAAADEQWRRA